MSMRTNGTRSPDEIQADIERTRARVHETLSAIEDRFTPSQLIDHGIDYLRHSGAREYVSNLGESAKQEPLPLALVGIGLAWLMLSNGRSRTAPSHVTSEDLAARARGSAASIAEGVKGTYSSVRDTAAHTTQRIGDTAHAARERASQMSAAARERAAQVRDGYDRIVNEHPLALGAIGLAVGAVLAAAAPRTREEDRLMGETSERMRRDARAAGREQLDRAASTLQSGDGQHHDELHPAAGSAPYAEQNEPVTTGSGPH